MCMCEFRKTDITSQKREIYLLMVAIVLHNAVIVYTDIAEKNGFKSAYFSGYKRFTTLFKDQESYHAPFTC